MISSSFSPVFLLSYCIIIIDGFLFNQMSEYVIDSMVHNDLGAHERVDSGVLQTERSFRPRQREHRVLRAVYVAVFDQQRQDHIGRKAQDESSA